ncbi:MAG: molybdopterin-dependent oxidoreductase [Candidatus Bathyarchaeia archaeon]
MASLLLVAVLIVSLFIVQNALKPSSTPKPSPAPPTISPTPTSITSPTPTALLTAAPSSLPTIPSTATPPYLFPGEVTQYGGQNLTPVYFYLTDLSQHPDVSIEGVQVLDPTTYRLTINGLVNQSMEYTYDNIISNFTSHQNVATLLCVEGWSVTCLWQGALVSDLIKDAGVSPNANTLIFKASDGYTTAIPLDYAVQNNLILAYKMNNVTLTAAAGWPLMLIPSNQYGYKWIRWITEIDVSNDSSYLGYWESRGYPNNATISNPGSLAPGPALSAAETAAPYVAVIAMVAVAYWILVRVKRKRVKNVVRTQAG